MLAFYAFLLGALEGLTEFLPVSSTGHLILFNRFFDLHEFKSLEIIIQLGAILAVVVLYWQQWKQALQNIFQDFSFFLKLFLAFLPSALVGLIFFSTIKKYLFGSASVIAALIVGGVFMILVERFLRKKPRTQSEETQNIQSLSYRQALQVGFFQILALWPGTSRSMSTILGGRLLGLSSSFSAEFSFLLAVPTLLAASFYDFYKNYSEFSLENSSWLYFVIASVTAFVVSLIVMKVFIAFLKKYSLAFFGYYRIILGLIIILILK